MNGLLLLLAVALLSASQVLQKVGAARRLAGTSKPSQWIAALFSPELLAAIACIIAGTALWLAVLYRMDVSRAFPFLSLTTVVVLAASRWYLREPVTLRRWAGVALIVVGIALVAST
ncbi:MAG TPA: EamA family transporter [Gammaproteobacteria bacterium]|nr:EamA family transporter [Gammaproteobacteria bacterium]